MMPFSILGLFCIVMLIFYNQTKQIDELKIEIKLLQRRFDNWKK